MHRLTDLSISMVPLSSHCLPVVSDVPQESALDPVLFITFSDVATCISSGSDMNMFADDIALYRIIKTAADYVHLLEDVNATSECIWEKDLQFNATKCKTMPISRKRSNMVTLPQIILSDVVQGQNAKL